MKQNEQTVTESENIHRRKKNDDDGVCCATNEIFNQITHLFENAIIQAVFLFVRWINIIRWIIATIYFLLWLLL